MNINIVGNTKSVRIIFHACLLPFVNCRIIMATNAAMKLPREPERNTPNSKNIAIKKKMLFPVNEVNMERTYAGKGNNSAGGNRTGPSYTLPNIKSCLYILVNVYKANWCRQDGGESKIFIQFYFI